MAAVHSLGPRRVLQKNGRLPSWVQKLGRKSWMQSQHGQLGQHFPKVFSQISTSVAKTFHFQKVFCNSLFQRCFALSTGALWGIECGYVPSCFFVCGGNHRNCTKPRVGAGDAEAIRLRENSNLFHYWWTFRTPKTVKFPNLLKNFGYFWLQNASVSGYMTNHLGQAEVTINCRP